LVVVAQDVGTDGLVQLGQLGALGFEEQKVVSIPGDRIPQEVPEDHLGGGARGQVSAPNHPGDTGFRIVDHHGQLVGYPAIGTPDQGVSHIPGDVLGKPKP